VGVAVVDDDRQARRLVLGVFQTSPEFQCCGCFSTAAEALDAIPKLPVRIALVGLSLPDLCGIQCIQALRLFRPNLRIILTAAANTDPSVLRRALAAGADTCCLKPLHAEQCLELLRSVASGLGPAHPRVPLTLREQEVVACRARGLPWKAIPGELGVSPSLVSKLRQRIHRKLKVHSSIDALRKWRELAGGG
jgi:DNA-binding NarL/FixJ family response regulator